MQSITGEVHSILKELDKISFSKEVAETLGLESAIILELYQNNRISNSKEIDKLIASVKDHAPFLEEKNIESNINKLIKYKFITANKSSSNYSIRLPAKSNFQHLKLNSDWQPSIEAIEILKMSDVPENFYMNKLNEFKLYWTERGQERNNWNTTYIDFIRREWAKDQSSNRGLPYSMDSSWIPSDDVYDILELSEISKESASKYLREFILYWKENGTAFTTWNSKFIEHVKRRHLGSQNINNEESKKHSEPGKYSKDFSSRTGDASWANEINFE